MSLARSHCLRTCFWYSSGSTRLLLRMPAAAFQLLGIRSRGSQTPCPFRVSTGVVVPIDSSLPQTATPRGPATASNFGRTFPSAAHNYFVVGFLRALCASVVNLRCERKERNEIHHRVAEITESTLPLSLPSLCPLCLRGESLEPRTSASGQSPNHQIPQFLCARRLPVTGAGACPFSGGESSYRPLLGDVCELQGVRRIRLSCPPLISVRPWQITKSLNFSVPSVPLW